MKLGIIGLGKMGSNLALNLAQKGEKISVTNRSKAAIDKFSKVKNVSVFYDVRDFCESLGKRKIIWIMVSAGNAVDQLISLIIPYISKGDIIIDGGNSEYTDSIRRYKSLRKIGVRFLDVGVSGGLEGARYGVSLTIGGDLSAFKESEKIFKKVSENKGYAYFGKSGAGHFLKTIHNGIEYALLESYAEGFEVLKKSNYNFDLRKVSQVWNNGGVIRSWILELAEEIFRSDGNLSRASGFIGGGETGRFALNIASKYNVEFKSLKHALEKRRSSKKLKSFSTKFVAEIRNKFGGHELN